MNDLIALARDVGAGVVLDDIPQLVFSIKQLQAFAKLVRAEQKEADAKLAESINDGCMGAPDGPEEIAAAIRAGAT